MDGIVVTLLSGAALKAAHIEAHNKRGKEWQTPHAT